MNSRGGARTNLVGEDAACAQAWDRLERAEARLQRAGGRQMVRAIDAFYDAWSERLAAIVAGDNDSQTMSRVEASLRLMEAAAATAPARRAMATFVSIAVLEVEAAVVRQVGCDLWRAGVDAGIDLDAVPPRGSC